VLVTLDTLRADHVGAYGGPPDLTPNLDALAREGLAHDAAFTTMPTTGPAHVSLFTGLAPHEHGSDRNGAPMRPEHRGRELAARLRRAGYATAAFVSAAPLAPQATGLTGFEVYAFGGGALHPGSRAVDAALRWLDTRPGEPVFLWVHLYDPHSPYGHPDQKRRSLPLREGEYGWIDAQRHADPAMRRLARERYAEGVHEADRALGRLVAGVRERLAAPPLVVVAADHGEALDEHLDARGYAYDHGEFLDPEQIRIPLVLSGPGVTPGRSSSPVSIRDLYATLLAAAGCAEASDRGADLRRPVETTRVVVIERRGFAGREPPAPTPAGAAAVRAHAAAATDGRGLVIVGEDGAAAQVSGEANPALEGAARAALARRGGQPAPALDAETEAALRSLGYAP
jgi:arylsulfatase A-like enzyme